MADHKITDFVDPSTIEGLKRLKDEMDDVKNTYIQVAGELVKGLKVSVGGFEDMERMTKDFSDLQSRAAEATKRHAAAVSEQDSLMRKTTATIAEALQGQNKLNREVRQSKVDYASVMDALGKVNGTYEEHVARIVEIEKTVKTNKKTIDDYKKSIESGGDATGKLAQKVLDLTIANRQLAQEKAKLNSMLKAEEKGFLAAAGSYDSLSQQLEVLKKAYKDMTEEQRKSAEGRELLESINQLDTELKHLAEDMGEHQRNVGNYAIACSQGAMSLQQFNDVLAVNASTAQECIEQNKQLEQAKLSLNREDANYAATVDLINQKIEENKRRILDVESVMSTQAKTVAEAEAQNKQLAEAIKLVDCTTEGGKRQIAEYNAKIAENKKMIEAATPALRENARASEGLANQLLSLVGANNKFGSSLQSLGAAAKTGNAIEGMGLKVKAFGQTLMGLLSNPWVLAFLGIAGVVAGVKWWYDYNKGLIQASRLTENFTGATGAAADKVTSDMQTVAEQLGASYEESIKSANVLVQQFGISWDEAYEKMKKGTAAGANMSGNMLANIERFAPALRDAGVSADEFMAILSNTRNGIFNEQGIQNIVRAGTRLRAMTKQTEEGLNAVGISAQKMQQDLESGNITMMEAVQQVAAKLKELPENSQEAGDIMKNVFGKTAAEGGTLLIQSIADVNTNLEEAIDNMGELGKLTEEQWDAQRRLTETMNNLFKMSGNSFEELTIKAKTFVIEGLNKILLWCVDVINAFIRWYNKSMLVRAAINHIVYTFKAVWDVAKFVVTHITEAFRTLEDVIDGVLELDVNKIVNGYRRAMSALQANVTGLVKNLAKDMGDAYKEVWDGSMKELQHPADFESTGAGGGSRSRSAGSSRRSASGGSSSKGSSSKGSSSKGEAERNAREELRLVNELEDAKLKAMDEGHEKELAQIRSSYERKIREIKGNSSKEEELRRLLTEEMNKALEECETKYQAQRESINLANRLAVAKKGSKEELRIKLEQLEARKAKEIEEAEKTGADIEAIEEKFAKEREELIESHAEAQVKAIEESYAVRNVIAENALNTELNRLKRSYAEELEAAKGNETKIEKAKERHERKVAETTERYAERTARASIEMYEEILKEEELSAEERAKMELELAKAKAELETAMADHAIAQIERITEADRQASDERNENIEKWLNIAADGLNAINDLSSAIFDRKIQRIEEEQEANEEATEKETDLITEMVEKKVISEEEGEARKRAAEAASAKKDEELEKKKQALKKKQAVWDKANSIAQAGIATALAITQALPNLVLAAIAGAMGAMQVATIIATPIPTYAKGTDSHKGGYAIVGDGGKSEIVSYGGNMYLTPSEPTVVDIPKGAVVYPDAEAVVANDIALSPITPIPAASEAPSVVVNNDYADLKREVVELGRLIKLQTKAQRKTAYRAEFERFKIGKGL